jgi:hypothetical protein
MKLDYDLIEEICQFRHNNNNGKWNDPLCVNLRDANLDDDGNIVASFLVERTGTKESLNKFLSPHLTDMFIEKGEYQRKLREKRLKTLGI